MHFWVTLWDQNVLFALSLQKPHFFYFQTADSGQAFVSARKPKPQVKNSLQLQKKVGFRFLSVCVLAEVIYWNQIKWKLCERAAFTTANNSSRIPEKRARTKTQLTTGHKSTQGQRSRQSFAFALIGCVIWDSGGGVKPTEEKKGEDEEEAWQALAPAWGMGHLNVNTPWCHFTPHWLLYTI